MATKQVKVDKNLLFIREQLSRYLYKRFKLKLNYKLYGNKELKKERRFSKITFPENKQDIIEIDIEYDTLFKGKKQELLDIAFRNSIRLGLWYTGRPYKDGHPEVESELLKVGLKTYGLVPEMGMDLHTYQCSECKKVYAMQVKKIPPSKNPVDKGFLTGCCKKEFEYAGLIFYDNNKLQTYLKIINKNSDKIIGKRNETGKQATNNSFFW